MTGLDLLTLVPLIVLAVGVPLTFWRIYAWTIRDHQRELQAESAARQQAEDRLADALATMADQRAQMARKSGAG